MITIHKPKMVALGKINPVAYNPRTITAAKFEALKESIAVNGFVHPLVVQIAGMNLIGGHQRRRALIELSASEPAAMKLSVPAIMLDVDDVNAVLLNVALNNTEGENDPEKLASVIRSVVSKVPLGSRPWISTGLSSKEIENLVHKPPPSSGDDGGRPFAASVTLSIAFDSVAERDACKGLIAERSTKSGKKSGTIVRELLERKTK